MPGVQTGGLHQHYYTKENKVYASSFSSAPGADEPFGFPCGSTPGAQTTTSSTTTTTTTTTTSTTTSPTTTATITLTTTTTQPPSAVATKLVKISGDNQQGAPGEELANPFVVAVQDQNGNLLAGVTVTFTVTAGGGTLSTTTPTTDANGQAQTTLTLGSTPGTNSVQASVSAEGIESTQLFSAEVPPPVATTLSKISGDNQQGAPGEELANPFVVAVQDQNGNLMAGVTVTFAVTAGGGTLSTTTPTTDANGQAQTTLTLGPMLGTNSVQASVEGIDQTQLFSAEVTLSKAVRKTVADVTGSGRETVQLYQFELQLQQGWNLIHLPLEVYAVNNELHRIQTAADLYQLIQPIFMFIYSSETGFIAVEDETDIALGPNQGIAVLTDAPATFTLIGTRLPSPFQFELGLNLVGLPRQSALQRVSDLLRVYEEAAAVITMANDVFQTVARAGDSGDHEITGGQSFFIIMTAPHETFFYGPAWGTPIK